MKADDPRHGTYAGYLAGSRCQPCRDARYKANKERGLYRHRHGSCRYDHEAQAVLIEPWLGMGITIHAVLQAAGLFHRNDLIARYQEGARVNRAVMAALSKLSEDKFHDGAKINSDLTRDRIYSLMAAGHPLTDMPILYRGNWRDQETISVGTARAMRDYYKAHSHLMGPSKITATRARNAGHQPPFAWDDPGTLAWPGGVRATPTTADVDREAVDEVKVQRVLNGRKQKCNKAEKYAVIDAWTGPLSHLEALAGWNVHTLIRERKDAA